MPHMLKGPFAVWKDSDGEVELCGTVSALVRSARGLLPGCFPADRAKICVSRPFAGMLPPWCPAGGTASSVRRRGQEPGRGRA